MHRAPVRDDVVWENITSYADPGWYQHPPGASATIASAEYLKRDLGEVPGATPSGSPMQHMEHRHGK